MSLNSYFTTILGEYEERKKQHYSSDGFTGIITEDLPREIISILGSRYVIKGSVGVGQWAETPWVAVMNPKVTTSTTRGYYVCYLFDTKAKRLYLCLVVGWTQFSEKYTNKEAVHRIGDYGKYLSNQLRSNPVGFFPGRIDLSAKLLLSKGYESGQIISKSYDLSEMPSENELLQDLKNITKAYDELTLFAGNDIENIGYRSVENNEPLTEREKKLNQITLEPNLENIKIELDKLLRSEPPKQRLAIIKKAVRNPKIARLIKEKSNYICEVCDKKPFIQKNGKPYAEADHIKPLGEEGFDSPDNMRCLCAQCHAVITHGSTEEIKKLGIK